MAVEITKVPQEIRDQFGSERTSALVSEISERLSLGNPRPVSKLLFLLETKGLAAHDFVQSLVRDTKVSEDEARTIAKEIKEKVFEPMRYALFQWGIDISDIKTGDAPGLDEITPEIESKEKSVEITGGENAESVVSLPIRRDAEPPQSSAPAPVSTSDTPFILHEEKKTEMAGGKAALRGFSIPLGFFKPKNRLSETGEPVRASIETPIKTEKRVVNYSELRTSLSPFGDADGFISPPKTGPVLSPSSAPGANEPAPEAKTRPIPSGTSETATGAVGSIVGTIKKPEARVDGNTIDLKS